MICPHCNYKDETEKFFKLELTLKRKYTDRYGYAENDSTELYACPECNKTFIDWRA